VVARFGGHSFFSAPALLFFPFSRVVGGNALRAKRQCKTNIENKNRIGQNGGNWPIPASEFIFLCQTQHKNNLSSFRSKTLRFSTRAKYTGCMADDTPQDTTTTQNTPAADQPLQEPPKVEEQPQEILPTETPTAEEPKPEVVPETPQTPEPPKQEEQKPADDIKPAEETKEEEKPKEETRQEEKVSSSPVPEPPKSPQINLDELRAKANKERQDRKQEHLSEVKKLAKSKQINNDDVRELLHVSQSTATNYLEELTKQGKIKKLGKAKATTYSS
jgi:hypothetical protein